VTSIVQESGQSSGQAVRTVDRPQVSVAFVRGLRLVVVNARCQMLNTRPNV
jgi:hypothetical protein